jgi:hypothetical protein
MMKKLYLMTYLAVLVTATAQTSAPPSPTPPSNTASLAATMKLIQDKVNAQGEIRYTMVSENTVRGGTVEDQYAVETSHAVADPDSCAVQVDARMSLNGTPQTKGRAGLRFRDITKLAVKTQTELIDEKTARAGVTGWKGKIVPENYVVQTFHEGKLSGMFFFRDRATAEDVATAISRAVELCGGDKVTF